MRGARATARGRRACVSSWGISRALRSEAADLVVSLHACDTATDAALDRAVRLGAQVILAVPCCQHELLPQLTNAPRALAPSRCAARTVRGGGHRRRPRAALRLSGFDVQLVELFPLEHSPKNVLLRAVRRDQPLASGDVERLGREYRAFADELGVDPALERLLRDELPPSAVVAP